MPGPVSGYGFSLRYGEGYEWIIELSLEKFLDRMNHDKLTGLLAKRIEYKLTLKLIRSYLYSGIMDRGMVSQRVEVAIHAQWRIYYFAAGFGFLQQGRRQRLRVKNR